MTRTFAFSLLKITISLAALSYVLWQTDLQQLWSHVRQLPPTALMGSFILLNIAQLLSSYRMQLYLKSSELILPFRETAGLYYRGMFYNTVLPSGIGGDGYKVYILNRRHALPVKTGIRLQLSERASGLLMLLLIFLALIPFSRDIFPAWLLIISALIIVACYRLGTAMLCHEKWDLSIRTAAISLLIQSATLMAVGALIMGWGWHNDLIDLLVIFLIASVAAIIPISVGGMGLREAVFLFGCPLFGINISVGVALSLVFYAVYLTTACIGALARTRHTSSNTN